MKLGICAVVSILLALVPSPASPQFDIAPILSSGVAGGIPIELTRPFGLVLVRVEVNGRPATLVVDTGCSNTILSTQLVQARGLALRDGASPSKPDGTSIRGVGSGWVGRAAWIKATVTVGEGVWRDHEFLAMDDLLDVSNALGQKVDGILGEDVLKDFALVEIDFKHRRACPLTLRSQAGSISQLSLGA